LQHHTTTFTHIQPFSPCHECERPTTTKHHIIPPYCYIDTSFSINNTVKQLQHSTSKREFDLQDTSMVIEIVRNRMVVGSRKGEWSKVYLEPILETDDLTTPDLAPELALYSRSYGTATENEPMLGEVAWEPLLNHEYFGSSVKAERLLLQRKTLWDAWRYLVAQNPADVALIKEQLQGSHRQRALLKELDKARKARTNSIRQKEQRRARKAQLLNPNVPAQSIEVSEDDSGLGSDTEDDEEDIQSEDGRRMPPPNHAVRRRGPVSHRGSVTRSSPMMSGGLGRFGSADRTVASPSSQTNAAKRKRPVGPELQRNSHARSESQHLFMTPAASGRPLRPEQNPNGEDGDGLDGHGANGGLPYKGAVAAAKERSLAPGEDGNVWGENGGLDFDDAMRAAMRQSMAPESDS
jgi:hypothetical protein